MKFMSRSKKTITNSNTRYKALVDTHHRKVVFDVCDQACGVLTCDKLLVNKYTKLKEMRIGSYEVLRRINDNTYRLHLPSHLKTFDVFNIKHLASSL